MRSSARLALAVVLGAPLLLPAQVGTGNRPAAEDEINVLVPDSKVGLSPSYGSVIALRDGGLLWAWGTGRGREPLNPVYGNRSSDGGRTWSDRAPLRLENGADMIGVFNTQLVRLRSGHLGLVVSHVRKSYYHTSRDEGATWSMPVRINPEGTEVNTTGDRALQLSTGRIVVPAYSLLAGPAGPAKPRVTRHGATLISVHRLYYSYAYYSDDEGRTWRRSANEVIIPREAGTEGFWGTEEPAIVELKDGRLMMLVRTHLGRFFKSYSTDQGQTWRTPEPTSLAITAAPCSLERIPQTGDLVVIWNQVSPWEVMTGVYRHRLSSAISKDDGETWRHFKNLESLDDTRHVEPGPLEIALFGPVTQPLDRSRYHRAPGWLRVSYPTCTFVDGKAVVTYGVSSLGERETITKTYGMDYDQVVAAMGAGPNARANRVRILPIDWFYRD